MVSGTAPDIDSILNPDKIVGTIGEFNKLASTPGF